ncbi:MAG TPA: hypothetical protein VLR92_09960, partial [Blastocatellia bacterium]|nr:hypothetical protein [Blastocatellia bacterium]
PGKIEGRIRLYKVFCSAEAIDLAFRLFPLGIAGMDCLWQWLFLEAQERKVLRKTNRQWVVPFFESQARC